MYPISYLIVVLYLASLGTFVYTAYNPQIFVVGMAFSAIFFLAATVMLGLKIKQRRSENEFRP